MFDLHIHSFKKSILVIKALVSIRRFPKTANVVLQCEKCWRRQLDSADLSETALLTRTKRISRMLEGHAKGNYCSQRTNRSLFFDLYFSEKVRLKWRENNLPTVMSQAFQSVVFRAGFGKVRTWERHVACLIDLHVWGRGPEVGKKEQESKSIKNNAVIEPVSGESSKGLLFGCGIFFCSKWMVRFVIIGFWRL